MRMCMLVCVALCGVAACQDSTCRDACYWEETDCLDEASSFAEEDQCRGAYEQCQWQCDDDELELQIDGGKR